VNASGTPKSGRTLNMLGQGDVDYIDYNISYYTIGALAQRMYTRGLYAYPAIPGAAATQPDLALAPRRPRSPMAARRSQ
jgi:peptide/nickel transport system substrate-binding protein